MSWVLPEGSDPNSSGTGMASWTLAQGNDAIQFRRIAPELWPFRKVSHMFAGSRLKARSLGGQECAAKLMGH